MPVSTGHSQLIYDALKASGIRLLSACLRPGWYISFGWLTRIPT